MSFKEWQVLPLEDCMDAIIDYRGKTPRKSPFGIPLITAKIVKGGRILEPTEFIPHEDYDDRMSRGIPKAGDIVITTEAPLGEVGQLDDRKLSVGQRLITLRGKNGLLDNTYLKYLMMSEFVQNQLLARATGTTVSGIKQAELRKIDLLIPPFPTQRHIADILYALDEKIETNRQTNVTLEAIAETIFKEWFVNFNFPESTNEMIESELGMIPQGWEVRKLGEVCEKITKGTTPTTLGDKFVEKGITFLRAECIQDDLGVDNSKALFINTETHEKLKRSQLAENDILITIAGSIGRIGMVTNRVLPANTNQAIGIIRVKPAFIPSTYIFYYLKQQTIKDELLSGITQSVQANISLSDLSNLKILIPPSSLTDHFHAITANTRKSIENLTDQSATLATLRDELLPKLMSGEINV